MGVLNGGTVDPDSGLDDDPIEGPGNDPQDSFTAEGLDFPWIIAMGNHDELILGNSPVSEDNKASGIGGRHQWRHPRRCDLRSHQRNHPRR